MVEVARSETRGLNPEQMYAVFQTFENPLTLMHGPPGTGKTLAIRVVLRLAVKLCVKVAVYAESNAVVDVIVNCFAADHGSQAPGYYRIHPTIPDEMALETTGHAVFN